MTNFVSCMTIFDEPAEALPLAPQDLNSFGG